jgi:hypothetical protein
MTHLITLVHFPIAISMIHGQYEFDDRISKTSRLRWWWWWWWCINQQQVYQIYDTNSFWYWKCYHLFTVLQFVYITSLTQMFLDFNIYNPSYIHTWTWYRACSNAISTSHMYSLKIMTIGWKLYDIIMWECNLVYTQCPLDSTSLTCHNILLLGYCSLATWHDICGHSGNLSHLKVNGINM